LASFAVGMNAIHPKSQLESSHAPVHNYHANKYSQKAAQSSKYFV